MHMYVTKTRHILQSHLTNIYLYSYMYVYMYSRTSCKCYMDSCKPLEVQGYPEVQGDQEICQLHVEKWQCDDTNLMTSET